MDWKISIFLKGVLMGISDLIPGISGGTIAFITGIYERLILAIKNITFKNYYLLFYLFFSIKKKDKIAKKKLIKKLDVYFLLILFTGLFLAILIGSNLISYLLENYYEYVFAFFIGLILASSLIINKQIKIHSYINKFFGFLGFFIGFLFVFLAPIGTSSPSFLYVIFGGFMAIFALFLPGISGSFILLVLGLYKYIIDSIKNISSDYMNLLPFIIGAGVGVFAISHLISFLFEKDKSKILYFLLGLVLGSLSVPFHSIYLEIEILTFLLFLKLVFLFLIGFFVVLKLEKL